MHPWLASLTLRALRRNPAKPLMLRALAALLCPSLVHATDLQISVHDPAGKPLADMVMYAESSGGAPAPRAAGAPAVIIDQIHKQFVPRVTVIQIGTPVDFPNSDNIRHEVYSFSPAKVFTSKLYSGKPAAPVVFDTPGAIAIGCNIHDRMLAWVRVVDTPYFAKSGADGSGVLAGLKPGDYRLNVWFPAVNSEPQVQNILVGAEGTTHVVVQLQPPAAQLPAATPATPATS